MQLDTNIALGIKPIQLESPISQMSNAYALQNAAQSNQLNQMKMDEYSRGVAEDTQIKNALTKLNSTSPTYEQDRYNAYALKGVEGLKALAAIKKEEAATGELGLKSTGQKVTNLDAIRKHTAATSRDIYNRPSDANATALYEDAVDSGLYPPEVLASMQKRMQQILAVPAPIDPTTGKPDYSLRQQTIMQMNLEAKDMLGKPGKSDIGGSIQNEITDPFGKVTVTGTTLKTPTPGELISKGTAERGQNMSAATAKAAQGITTSEGALNRQNAKDVAKLRNSGDLTPEQNDALYGPNGAVTLGKLDPYKINSRNSHILANAYMGNPNIDMNKLASDAGMMRNAPTMNRAYTTEQLPTIISNVVEAGKKVGYNDNKYFGKVQEYLNGVSNDPDFVNYMTQRNDALLTITSIMRGNGATDQAHRAEIEAAPSTMSPRAFDAWAAAQMKALEPRIKQANKFTRSTPAAPASPATTANPHANKTDAQIKAELGL